MLLLKFFVLFGFFTKQCFSIQQLTCDNLLSSLSGGDKHIVNCPQNCLASTTAVKPCGNGVTYSGTGSVCLSAIHNGEITDYGGAFVVFKNLVSTTFVASTQNGVMGTACSANPTYSFVAPQVACPAGWVQRNSSCYYMSDKDAVQQLWADAKKTCVGMGSSLAKVTSAAENSFLFTQTTGGNVYWLGGSDIATEGLWQWTDGTNATYKPFNAGQPDNWVLALGGREDCLSFERANQGKWNDASCLLKHYFICEKPVAVSGVFAKSAASTTVFHRRSEPGVVCSSTSLSNIANDCATNRCLNGGSCVDISNGFYCTCKTGFSGGLCETAPVR